MSDNKQLTVVSEYIESIGEVEASHDEMTSIRGDNTSTAGSHEDGEEINAASLAGAPTQSLPRINVYENILFADGDGDYSILSVLFGAHSIGEGIFSF